MSSITFTADSNFNAASVKQRLSKNIARAQQKLDAQVIADSNFYCPIRASQGGTLQKSATINTVLGSGLVIWRTPYARRQYYGVNFDRSQDPNPNACGKWFEAAKARDMQQWEKLVNDECKHS